MSSFDASIQRFRAMPRIVQWALIAAVIIVAGLFRVDYVNGWTDSLDSRSRAIMSQVAKIQESESTVLRLKQMEPVVESLGPVQPPRDEIAGAAAFTDLLQQVMDKHGATNASRAIRSRGKLPKTSLSEIVKTRVDKLTGELKFDATPQATAAIIADLESSPHVESVSSVRMARDSGGKLKVQLLVEAWVMSSS